jgi:proteic killer suppression protein
MDKVVFDKVSKQLRKVPYHVVKRLMFWARSVEVKGLRETRKIPGYHDEPLKGIRQGQRSIRLNKSYRAIYTVRMEGTVSVVVLEEGNHHEY